MSEETVADLVTDTTAAQEVSQQDLALAVEVIAQWHKANELSFAVVNSGSGILVSSGNSLELECALNHAHKIIESENGRQFYEIRTMQQGAQAGRDGSIEAAEA